MTTYDLDETMPQARVGLFAGLRQALARFADRRHKRRATIELTRMDERLLRDIGIEPMDVYDALNGRNRSALFDPVRRHDHE